MSIVQQLPAAWDYLLANQEQFFQLLVTHLQLVLVAVVCAILVAVPGGILATRRPKLKRYILGFGNVAQSVPTIAIIFLVFPVLGIGFTTALVGLFTYAILPILTNTIAGTEDVDESIVEAAQGMGTTDWEILRRIQLTLALPVIFAGIRTASVITVGTAYLAFFIGGGGLGLWVVVGIKLFNTPQELAGA
ncbi:ABC transporter permease [Halobaculum roseum]|uniref:ABC transporter permease n=1 Tax=Halobaculum roseum TaxID=2175149 RepID=A0ABD5MQB2_9EURY|nr:ABC transporter permease [Halobaculum roseum]QZY04571.1 ABC transporter permease [Halobaculum roseum]